MFIKKSNIQSTSTKFTVFNQHRTTSQKWYKMAHTYYETLIQSHSWLHVSSQMILWEI